MSRIRLRTDRLDLVALDSADISAWVAGDAETLSRRTGASFPVPPTAPPLFEDLASIRDMMGSQSRPEPPPVWLIVERDSRRPAGIAGVNAARSPGIATIGYSVYPHLQGRGFATEALRELTSWLFASTEVARVRATIPAGNAASIRVAEKLHMLPTGTAEDAEVGAVLVYELTATGAGESSRG